MNGVHDMGGMQGLVRSGPRTANQSSMRAGKDACRQSGPRSEPGANGTAISAARRGNLFLRRNIWHEVPPKAVRAGRGVAREKRHGHARGDRKWAASERHAEGGPAAHRRQSRGLVCKGNPKRRDVAVAPKFQVGQRVRARNINPTGSHAPAALCARQARHRSSAITACSSSPTPTPTSSARNRSMCTRCASPRASCGASKRAPQDTVIVAMWDDYLEPA